MRAQQSPQEIAFFKNVAVFIATTKETPIKDSRAIEKVIHSHSQEKILMDALFKSMSPSVAKVVQGMQKNDAPSFAGHPFFKKVDEIARSRWSKAIQELLDAGNFLLQIELGLDPVLVPEKNALDVVIKAKRSRVSPMCPVLPNP